MPIDPTPYLDPNRCAVVNMECQEGLLGPSPVIAGLAESARQVGLVDNVASILAAGRRVGVRTYYCTDERRSDGFGRNRNLFVHRRMSGTDAATGEFFGGHGPVVAPIAPSPDDVVIRREQGLTGFLGTGLDMYLRNTGVDTVILTGVSLNIAVLGTAIEAMNLGYWVVVPRDCVASDPPEYADHVLRYTMRNIALVTEAATIARYWDTLPPRSG